MQEPAFRHPISTVLVFMTRTHDLLRRHAFSFKTSIGVSQLIEANLSAKKHSAGLPTTLFSTLTKSGGVDYKRFRT
jgi:hypothetical protein